MFAEIRLIVRGLARSPALTLSAIVCLALGLGATTAIFTAVDAALLRPLSFPESDRLVSVFRTTPHFDSGPFSAPNYHDLKRETRSLRELAAATPWSGLLQSGSMSVRAAVLSVSENYFTMLGAEPLLGRLLGPGGDGRAAEPIAVLSAELWRERFGGDPGVLHRTVRLDADVYQVVGVLPPGFRVPHGGRMLQADVWVPLVITSGQASARRSNYLMLQGRLGSGVAVDAADEELRRIMDGIIEEHPELRGEQLRAVSLQGEAREGVRRPLILLLGAVLLVLLVAAANVASLLLARGVARRGEWAIRTAIGASRLRLLATALLESAVLGIVGALLGSAVAWAAVRLLANRAVNAGLPQLADMAVDLRVLGFGLAVAAIAALLAGAAPAWQAQRSQPQEALRSDSPTLAGGRHHRFLRGLVAAEVAFSFMLLLGGSLLLTGFRELMSQDPGFDPTRILSLEVDVPADHYPDGSATNRFLEPALEAVEGMPGVERAAAISLLPYRDWGWNFNIRYEGVPGDDPTRLPLVERRVVTPGFFETMGMTLLRGRLLEQADDERPESPAVVVVNRTLAEQHFPGEDPIGKRFHLGEETFATIVGVVSDIRNAGPYNPPQPEVYWTYDQGAPGATSMPLVVRVDGDPAAVAQAVARTILQVEPEAAVSRTLPMTEVFAASTGRPRFVLTLLAIFAGVAVVLAMAGLFGVTSYLVEQRQRELGIRLALGGTSSSNLALVLHGGFRLVAGGLAAGVAGGLLLRGLIESLLFGVHPLDFTSWITAALLLAAAASAAIVIAAERAAGVDPLVAIRG